MPVPTGSELYVPSRATREYAASKKMKDDGPFQGVRAYPNPYGKPDM